MYSTYLKHIQQVCTLEQLLGVVQLQALMVGIMPAGALPGVAKFRRSLIANSRRTRTQGWPRPTEIHDSELLDNFPDTTWGGVRGLHCLQLHQQAHNVDPENF